MSRISSLSLNLPLMEEKASVSSELTPTRLGFPNEFPYEFDSPAFSPGFTSPGDSTETEDESSDDEEDFLAGLTRRLAPSTHRLPPLKSFTINKPEEKRQVAAATSPQSTLSGLGSFSNSGSRSPILPQPPLQSHTTSFRRDNAWDVISAAAGEVAKLKLGSYESYLPLRNPNPNPSLPLLRRQNAAFHQEQCLLQQQQQQQRILDQMWLCSQIKSSENLVHVPRRVVNDEVTWEKMRYMRYNNALSNATWLPQAPLKRPSAGTGVFLPRRYPTTPPPSESFKKPVTVNATTMLQSKVNPQNLNFDETRLNQFDYECMLARSTLVGRQGNFRGVGRMNQERRLPQDWMY
ncbi:hypothetical protein AALP_AA4G183900 [Arabis alpina]|uniref:Uncharacterized protein n=1 Tax=Arabis alpina TaxID=50452 RepID=A0A087H429_ARAAL|nr:hypothetical protein AALP_AA4G183900 [Arabis alpina]